MTDFEAGVKAASAIAQEVMRKGITDLTADADRHMVSTLVILKTAITQLALASSSDEYITGVRDALEIIESAITSLRPN